jgi:hypothetical protein
MKLLTRARLHACLSGMQRLARFLSSTMLLTCCTHNSSYGYETQRLTFFFTFLVSFVLFYHYLFCFFPSGSYLNKFLVNACSVQVPKSKPKTDFLT